MSTTIPAASARIGQQYRTLKGKPITVVGPQDNGKIRVRNESGAHLDVPATYPLRPSDEAESDPELLHLPVGTHVMYWSGVKGDNSGRISRTRSERWNLGGDVFVNVQGYGSGVAITHIEVLKRIPVMLEPDLVEIYLTDTVQTPAELLPLTGLSSVDKVSRALSALITAGKASRVGRGKYVRGSFTEQENADLATAGPPSETCGAPHPSDGLACTGPANHMWTHGYQGAGGERVSWANPALTEKQRTENGAGLEIERIEATGTKPIELASGEQVERIRELLIGVLDRSPWGEGTQTVLEPGSALCKDGPGGTGRQRPIREVLGLLHTMPVAEAVLYEARLLKNAAPPNPWGGAGTADERTAKVKYVGTLEELTTLEAWDNQDRVDREIERHRKALEKVVAAFGQGRNAIAKLKLGKRIMARPGAVKLIEQLENESERVSLVSTVLAMMHDPSTKYDRDAHAKSLDCLSLDDVKAIYDEALQVIESLPRAVCHRCGRDVAVWPAGMQAHNAIGETRCPGSGELSKPLIDAIPDEPGEVIDASYVDDDKEITATVTTVFEDKPDLSPAPFHRLVLEVSRLRALELIEAANDDQIAAAWDARAHDERPYPDWLVAALIVRRAPDPEPEPEMLPQNRDGYNRTIAELSQKLLDLQEEREEMINKGLALAARITGLKNRAELAEASEVDLKEHDRRNEPAWKLAQIRLDRIKVVLARSTALKTRLDEVANALGYDMKYDEILDIDLVGLATSLDADSHALDQVRDAVRGNPTDDFQVDTIEAGVHRVALLTRAAIEAVATIGEERAAWEHADPQELADHLGDLREAAEKTAKLEDERESVSRIREILTGGEFQDVPLWKAAAAALRKIERLQADLDKKTRESARHHDDHKRLLDWTPDRVWLVPATDGEISAQLIIPCTSGSTMSKTIPVEIPPGWTLTQGPGAAEQGVADLQEALHAAPSLVNVLEELQEKGITFDLKLTNNPTPTY